jgi:glutamate-1-semialdehyde 2,1-aminomutase
MLTVVRNIFVVCAAPTLTANYNDVEEVRRIFEANKGQIAGVILEPVVGNSGFIPPTREFLQV